MAASASASAAPAGAAAPSAARLPALVKSVVSADMVVLQGPPPKTGGPPPERTLGLDFIVAPRVARYPGGGAGQQQQSDEPYGWEAREFVRRKLVGKKVAFVIDHKTSTGREYGQVILEPGTAREENITLSLVQQGLVKIREGARGKDEFFEQLQAAEAAAKAAGLGVWGSDGAKHVRKVTWDVENKRALVDSSKSKQIDAIIEQVPNGCTIRAFLLPSFNYVTINLSGIKTPMFKRGDDNKEVAEPFAAEAKQYVESRLLQREVKIILEGVSNNNAFLGTVIHPFGGNISEHLLREGLAKVVDWSIGSVTLGPAKYRAAEKEAQLKKLRLWRDYEIKEAVTPAGDRQFKAVVQEIISPEQLVVRNERGSRRIHLASLRQPKAPQADNAAAGEEGEKKGRSVRIYESPLGFEAREFLRKKVIGKEVNVLIDYVQPANAGFPEKVCCTVKIDGINLAEALISKGLATAIVHRGGDENRSSEYDNLLAAQTRASKAFKGVHEAKQHEALRITDVNNKTIADRFLPSLQRAGRVQGIVEFISSGSRLRVLIPKDSCIVTVVLAGIACPRTGRDEQPDEPFAQAALLFTRQQALQHDVELDVEDNDKTGGFVGHIFVNGKNLGVELLRQGLATVHRSVDRYKYADLYASAEREAQNKRLHLWENYDPAAAAAAAAAAEAAAANKANAARERKVDHQLVVVTEVASGTVLYVQKTDSSALDALMAKISSLMANNREAIGNVTPKKNLPVLAQFSLDNAWYRARITEIDGDSITVFYADYGNSERVKRNRLAALPAGCGDLPPQAFKFNIALLVPPPGGYADDARATLAQFCLNKKLLCNVEYTIDDEKYASFMDDGKQHDLAESLCAAGYGIAETRASPALQELLQTYTQAMNEAKQNRLGIWRYGDILGDDKL